MDIIFNELSASDAASTLFEAKDRMLYLLKSSKSAFDKGFRKIRFNDTFYESPLAENYTVNDWLNDKSVSPIVKNLFYGVKVHPYIDPNDSETEDKFIEGYFYYNEIDTLYPVEGLAVAYLMNTLSISFASHDKWDKSKIQLIYDDTSKGVVEVNHFSKEAHLLEHQVWIEERLTLTIQNVPKTGIAVESKIIHLRDDHGKDILLKFCKKLVRSSYVIGVVNSLPFNAQTRSFIKFFDETGLIEIVLTRTDKGLGIVVQTTGRNKSETRLIAERLQVDFEKEY
jgi:hypothetical protein